MAANEIKILYEDADVLVINKPAGLVVHSDGRSTSFDSTQDKSLTAGKTVEPTLVDWILEHYPETKGVGEPLKIDSRIKIQDSGAEKEEKSSDSIPESKILNRESILIDRPGVVHRLDRETSGVLVIAKNQ